MGAAVGAAEKAEAVEKMASDKTELEEKPAEHGEMAERTKMAEHDRKMVREKSEMEKKRAERAEQEKKKKKKKKEEIGPEVKNILSPSLFLGLLLLFVFT